LINLLVNAAQAIETRGTITVTTRFQGTAVEIYVEDTGKGIPPEQIGKVFDPFFTTKDVGKGTGMGLSISHGIISRHGGTIEVNSSPGKGSVFKISLPASPDTDEDSNFEEDTEK
jgi:signal transduction histidine kinase